MLLNMEKKSGNVSIRVAEAKIWKLKATWRSEFIGWVFGSRFKTKTYKTKF